MCASDDDCCYPTLHASITAGNYCKTSDVEASHYLATLGWAHVIVLPEQCALVLMARVACSLLMLLMRSKRLLRCTTHCVGNFAALYKRRVSANSKQRHLLDSFSPWHQ